MNRSFTIGALAAAATLGHAGCFFPEFTFNGDTGGGGATTTSTDGGGGTTMTTSTTTGGGGAGGTGGTPTGGGGTGGMTTSMTTGGMGGTAGMGGMGGMGGFGGTPTGGGGTGGMTTTTTTTPPLENCQNSVDDDGDLAIDCQDTDCVDFSCVSPIPNGWTGYYQLYEGTLAGAPPCTTEFPVDAFGHYSNLNAPPAMCSSCSCGTAQGQVCTPPSVINGLDVPCGGTPSEVHPLIMPAGWGACTSADDGGGGYYFPANLMVCGPDDMQPCHLSITADAPTVQGGFCSASMVQTTLPPAVWEGYAHACGGPNVMGKGCALNQVCLPKPQAPNVTGVCIKKAGDVNCPAGQFNVKHLFYDDFTEGRTCTSCQCGAPTGSTCAGNITTHADSGLNSCLSPVATFQAGTCTNLTGNPAIGNSKFTVTTPPTAGSCAPSGGQPSGMAVKTFPQTYCCIND
jgi:hypothetical protein